MSKKKQASPVVTTEVTPPAPLSSEPIDLAEMTTEEILDELLFESHFTIDSGPVCDCYTSRLTHFHGMIPDKLCGQNIDEVDLTTVPEFDSTCSTLCSCQQSHFFRLKIKDSEITFERCDGKNMDDRKLRLPNYK